MALSVNLLCRGRRRLCRAALIRYSVLWNKKATKVVVASIFLNTLEAAEKRLRTASTLRCIALWQIAIAKELGPQPNVCLSRIIFLGCQNNVFDAPRNMARRVAGEASLLGAVHIVLQKFLLLWCGQGVCGRYFWRVYKPCAHGSAVVRMRGWLFWVYPCYLIIS